MATSVDVRTATPADQEAVVELLRVTMQAGDDQRYGAFLAWKHRENPFGPSLEWVATIGGEIVGYRAFLRWRFVNGGNTYAAVRAVDTATHPAHQGKGIFRMLTTAAVDVMTAAGIDFIFNTPNDQSRPGYLKMGWRELGRVPFRLRPAVPPRLGRLMAARHPAERFGSPAPEAFPTVDEALPAVEAPHDGRLRTHRSQEFLCWRYGLPSLAYRVALDGAGTPAAIFRVRHRGAATEATFAELADPARPAPLVRSVLRATRADFATLRGDAVLRAAPLISRWSPTLCVRDLASTAPASVADFALDIGDVELL